MLTSPLAYVGNDEQLHLVRADGSGEVRLSAPVPASHEGWASLAPLRESWTWPTFAPDGASIACFVVATSDTDTGDARMVSLSVDGAEQVEWGELSGGSPIYLQWHPSGHAISVLSQQDGDLVLGAVRRGALGQVRPVETGVPLFFGWTPTGDRVLIHAGEPDGPGRLVLRDPFGDAEDVVLPRPPGSFCTPVFSGTQAIYAVADEIEGFSEVLVSHASGRDARVLARYRGLVALVAAPSRPWVAVAASPRGEASPYKGIDLVHLYTGEVRRLVDMDCLAFFWSPTGEALIVAVVDAPANCLTWWKVDTADGARTRLGTFWPSRDMLFYLHFFEQYVGSHPLVSPDGRWLVYAGFPAGEGQADLSAPPRIWVKDLLDPQEPARPVAGGTFGTFPSALPRDTRALA